MMECLEKERLEFEKYFNPKEYGVYWNEKKSEYWNLGSEVLPAYRFETMFNVWLTARGY